MSGPWQPGSSVSLETPRLQIRTLTEADAEVMRDWLAEPAFRENLWLPDLDLSMYFVWMARGADQRTRFAFALAQAEQLVGFAKLAVDAERRTQIPTVALRDATVRDRGLGTEATWALLTFGFEHLPVDRAEFRLYAENVRLRQRLERLGCREVRAYDEQVPGRASRRVHSFALERGDLPRVARALESRGGRAPGERAGRNG